MANINDEFVAGQRAKVSGIYRVTHLTGHAESHHVTVVFGEAFPTCRLCGDAVFKLERDATHVLRDENFADPLEAIPSAPRSGFGTVLSVQH